MTESKDAFAGATALVVDDDADVRTLLALHFRSIGFRVQAVEDGKAALAVLDGTDAIDVLCTDIIMPGGMTGYGVADAAVARRPGIRVMFVTGYAPSGRAHGQQRHPHAPMLNKPFSRKEFAAAVLEAFGRHDAQIDRVAVPELAPATAA
jgi:two-component system, chemotaxis family, CheB/CheR fusion protein